MVQCQWYQFCCIHVEERWGDRAKNFIHGNDTSADSASPRKFDKDWIYTSMCRGGLDLTPVKEFILAILLKSLGEAIAATCDQYAAPRRITPAISLLSL